MYLWTYRVAQPLFLSQLIRYFDTASGMSSTEAYLYASGVFLCSVSHAFARSHCYVMRQLGLQVRIALRSLIFKKVCSLVFKTIFKNYFSSVFLQCLLLTQRALRQEASIGQIINLMTNDVNRFDDATVYFNYLWVSPIHVIITTTILYFVLGSSCFVGLLIIFNLAYFQGDLLQ